jgi:hypothetical protein
MILIDIDEESLVRSASPTTKYLLQHRQHLFQPGPKRSLPFGQSQLLSSAKNIMMHNPLRDNTPE